MRRLRVTRLRAMDGPTNSARIYLLEQGENVVVEGGPAIVGPDGVREDIPPLVFEAVRHVVEAMRAGMGVKVSPLRPELPVDEAAYAIGMHEDTFRKYVADGEVPFRSTEYVDWVKLADVIAFTQRHRERRREGMRQLRQLLEDEPSDDLDEESDSDGQDS